MRSQLLASYRKLNSCFIIGFKNMLKLSFNSFQAI